MRTFKHKPYPLFLLVFLAVIGMQACEEEAIEPEEIGFPIVYKFLNESGKDLRIVNFTTYTYYPEEDITTLSYQHFKPVLADEIASIKVDTSSNSGRMAYPGCQTLSEFEIWVELPANKAYVSTWQTHLDTIRTINDSVVSYSWPSDTLRWQKLRGIVVDL